MLDALQQILLDCGYIGVFLGTFAAATVIPFASDALMIGMLLAGTDPVITFVVATAGNWLGGLTTYWIGYAGRWEWIEKWFKVSRQQVEKQSERVEKWGSLLGLMTWLPFIGDVFALVLGFYRCSFIKSAVSSLIGRAGRFAVWMWMFK